MVREGNQNELRSKVMQIKLSKKRLELLKKYIHSTVRQRSSLIYEMYKKAIDKQNND